MNRSAECATLRAFLCGIFRIAFVEQEQLARAAFEEIGSPFGDEANNFAPITDSISSLGDRLVEEIGREISIRLDAVNQNLGSISLNQTTRFPQHEQIAVGQEFF